MAMIEIHEILSNHLNRYYETGNMHSLAVERGHVL